MSAYNDLRLKVQLHSFYARRLISLVATLFKNTKELTQWGSRILMKLVRGAVIYIGDTIVVML